MSSTDDARKRRLRTAAVASQWLLTIGTVVAIAWITWSHRGSLSPVFKLDMGTFLWMSASVIVSFIANGVEMRVLVRKFGPTIKFADTARFGLMVSTLNYLPMKMGTLLLGVVMRTRYKVHLADFAAVIAGSTVMYLWVGSTFAGAFLMLTGRVDSFSWILLVVPSLGVALLALFGWWRRDKRDNPDLPRVLRVVMRAIDGVGVFFTDPVLLAKDFAINVWILGQAAFETRMAMHALSTPIGWGKAIAITGIANFAARLGIVSGGLGFREGAAAAGAVAVGLAGTLGFGSAMIDRAINLLWLAVLGVPATLYVQRATGLHVRMSLEGGSVEGEGAEEGAPAAASATPPEPSEPPGGTLAEGRIEPEEAR